MPREIRKRGKKHKKSEPRSEKARDEQENYGEPSWIVSAPEVEDQHPEAPFGYLEPDIKAYFRNVDEQIQSWQEEVRTQTENEDDGLDPNEAKRVFFIAALGEMSGKEKQLTTDPDCSVVLERMAYSMDDFVLRVFMDRLSGSFQVLFKHRFASHVCQTLLSVAIDTISREVKGIFPDVPTVEENGELRTLTQLVLDICEEIGSDLNMLIMDSFASHALRSLLLLLCPNVLPEDTARKSVRSKKSMSWKAKRGPMKSVFSDEKGKQTHAQGGSVPSSFRKAANEFVRVLRDGLDGNEVRALAIHKVAGPVLQLLLEIEADNGSSSSPDSLMDRVLVGMIKAYHKDPTSSVQASDYLITLLRDPTSSHLLETLVSRCPGEIFILLWSTYFDGNLARLALHPIANFVLARAIERQDSRQLGRTLEELESSWTKLIKSSRVGVLRALIDRSRALESHQKEVCEAVCAAVEIRNPDDKKHVVHCMLLLKPPEECQAILAQGELSSDVPRNKRDGKTVDQREPKVQGALILQSLMRLDEPHCLMVVDSISSLSMEDLIRIAQNAAGSRVLDVLFESPTVPFKAKRRLVMSLIGHYHALVDDRIGSRVVDRCWAFSDPYLREKIARSLIPFEQFLASSFYGKFFARNLNLYLLQRRPEEWKALQSKAKTDPRKSDQNGTNPVESQSTSAMVTPPSKSSKKRLAPEDEIDAVFNATLGNKRKKAAVGRVSRESQPSADRQMLDVLGAIREAPSGGNPGHTKKRKVK